MSKGLNRFKKHEIAPPRRDIKRELLNIYKDSSGRLPDMSHIERRQRSRLRTLLFTLIIFLAFLAGVSWAALFIFRPDQNFSGEGVKLEIKAPEKIGSGEDITYTLTAANLERVPLGNVELSIRYPEGFVFKESLPLPTQREISVQGGKGSVWSLGTLPRNKAEKIELKGQLIGELDSKHSLQATLLYKPANFNAEFQETASHTIEITESILNLSIKGPERILAEEKVKYEIKYKNTSTEDLKDIQLTIAYPGSFVLNKKQPEATENKVENDIWKIDKLNTAKEGAIEIEGSFEKNAVGSQEFKIQIGLLIDKNFYLQQEKTFITEIVKGDLIVNFIINGSTTDNTVNFRDTLTASISYKNNGQSKMSDLELAAVLDSSVLDWASLKDDRGGKIQDARISWTASEILDLEFLEPGKEGVIDFSIKIKAKEEVKDYSNLRVESKAEAKIGQMEGLGAVKVVESNSIVTKVNTDLILTAEGRYYDTNGLVVGSGPLPPQVGQTTTYRIFWILTNSIHEVTNAKVVATLPADVFWTNQYRVSAGEMKYDPNARLVTWTVNRLPASVLSVNANFDISITPKAEDRGKVITLIPNTLLTARDKVTSGGLSQTKKVITTELEDDSLAGGKGVIE